MFAFLMTLVLSADADAARAPIRCPRGTRIALRKHEIGCRRWRSKIAHGPQIKTHPRGAPWRLASDGHFADGQLHGTWTEWFPNGQVRTTGTWDRGVRVGLWREWHPNGTLRWARAYDAQGRLHGAELRWYDNGDRSEIAEHIHGQRIGAWMRWRADGLLLLHEEFDHCGRLMNMPVDGHRHGMSADIHRVQPPPLGLGHCQ
ncbi:MAG: hypothetical protein AAFV53_37115 [Myxococcota bacterium]